MNSMILAASGVSIAINLLLVINVAVCLLLCLLVLMQRPKQEGLGAAFGGGMTDQAFGARTTDVLQKGTVYLGTAFFVVTLVLSVLVSATNKSNTFETQTQLEAEAQKEDPKIVADVNALAGEADKEVALVQDAVKEATESVQKELEAKVEQAFDTVKPTVNEVKSTADEAVKAVDAAKEKTSE